MKTPILKNKILALLRDDILALRLKPGSALAPEPELAADYGISRGTLRYVLAELENEKLISRIKGRGTFVNAERECPQITYLTPVSEYADAINNLDYSALMHTYSIQGITNAVFECDAKLEILPITPDNNPDHIDFRRLFGINRESRVIVPGTWYKNIFSYLRSTDCRVALLYEKNYIEDEYLEASKNFSRFILDNRMLIHDLVLEMARRGSKRPALIAPPVEEKERQRVYGFEDALRETGLNGIVIPLGCCAEESLPYLAEVYKKKPFDSLIAESLVFNAAGGRNRFIKLLGAENDIKFAAFNPDGVDLSGYPGIYVLSFNRRKVASDAAKYLLSDNYEPKAFKYQAEHKTGDGK